MRQRKLVRFVRSTCKKCKVGLNTHITASGYLIAGCPQCGEVYTEDPPRSGGGCPFVLVVGSGALTLAAAAARTYFHSRGLL